LTVASLAPAASISPEVLAERRRALRSLVRTPLLPASGETSAEYQLVRRHFEWLKQWFAKFPEWKLSVDKSVARLRKIPGDFTDPNRPAIDRRSRTEFTKRRYSLLCLVLAALERTERETSMSLISREVQEYSKTRELQDAGLHFEADHFDHRRDLVHAVRWLSDNGVLKKKQGDEKAFLYRTSSLDVHYDLDRHVLAVLLQGSRNPSEIDAGEKREFEHSTAVRVRNLTSDSIPVTDQDRSQLLRSKLIRLLLDDPVVYFEKLSDEEKNYLERHRNHLLREIQDGTELLSEVRHEGIAMVDQSGDLTDIPLPDRGYEGLLMLQLVQWLAECFKQNPDRVFAPSEIDAQVRNVVRNAEPDLHREPAATDVTRISQDLMARLRSLSLIQSVPGGVLVLAPCCRFASAGSRVNPNDEVSDGRSVPR